MLKLKIALIILWAPLLACSAREPAPVDAVLKAVEEIRNEYHVAAVGMALVRDGKILYAGSLGVNDWQSDTPVDKNTLYRLGSITKSFTGLTALRLHREHPVLLTQPINKVLPGLFSDVSPTAITLAHLLEHTAGFSDLSKAEFGFQGERVTYEDAIEISPETRQLKWPVGKHSSYSNAGYGYAGYYLEAQSGMPYEQLVQAHVLQPLDMKDSGFFITEDTPTLAAGYDRDGKTPIPYWHMIYRSFGGLNSTPADMAKFLRAMVAGDEQSSATFLTKKEQQRFENPTTTLAAQSGLDYGYGLGNYHWFTRGRRFHGHGGDADGYLSHYGYHRESKSGYFVVITAFNKKPLKAIRNKLEAFIADDAKPLDRINGHVAPEQLKQWVGHYSPVTQRFAGGQKAGSEVEVRIAGDALVTLYKNDEQKLIPVTAQHFRRKWQPRATYAFVIDESGDTFLQSDMGNFKKQGTRRR